MHTQLFLQPIKTIMSIVIAFVGYFGLLSISNSDLLNLYSLIISYFASLFAISLMYFLLEKRLKQKKLLLFSYLIFSIRFLVGVFHYLYFFEPDYLFEYISNFNYFDDYIWLNDSMTMISRTLDGTIAADNEQAITAREINKNYEMIFFMSLLFFFGGEKVLVVASFNSLIAIFSAFLVYKISFSLRQSKRVAFFCFILVALQPMEFISSILAIDIFGQFIVILAIYLILSVYHTVYLKYIITLIASLLTSFVREVYALIPIFTIFIAPLLNELTKGFISKKSLISILLIFIIAIIGYDFVINKILYRFLDQNFLSLIFQLPISLVYSIVGPFPWTQIFLQPPGYEFHIPQYLTPIYNLALIFGTLKYILKYKLQKTDYLILSFVFLFFLSGILVYGGRHTTYYSIAIPLLVLFDKNGKLSLFLIRFFLIFMFWVLMNVIYTLIT